MTYSSEHTVFVPTTEGTIHAVDGETGVLQWTQSFDNNEELCQPSVGQSLVYVTNHSLSDTIPVYAVNRTTGQVEWQIKDSRSTQPVASSNMLYISDIYGYLTVFNSNGTQLCRHQLPNTIRKIIPVSSDTVYVHLDSGPFFSVSPSDSDSTPTRLADEPIKDVCYHSDNSDNLLAVFSIPLAVFSMHNRGASHAYDADFVIYNPQTQTVETKLDGFDNKYGDLMAADGVVIGVTPQTRTLCMAQLPNGKPRWELSFDTSISKPALSSTSVYVITASGTLESISLDAGITQWEVHLNNTLPSFQPVLSPDNTTIYAPTSSQTLSAFDTETGDEIWSLTTSSDWSFTTEHGAIRTPMVAENQSTTHE